MNDHVNWENKVWRKAGNMNKKKNGILLSIIFLTLLFTYSIVEADTYKIDPTHSTVGFTVRHMKIGVTRGVFTDFHGEITFDKDDLDATKGWMTIRTDSLDTRLKQRDDHLKSEAFFNVEEFPTITFIGKKIVKKGDKYEITGELTIKGISKDVSGMVEIRGPVKSPFGQDILAFSGETVIKRQDYNISWNDLMPDGGFVVSHDVKIIIDVEADKN